MKRLATHTRFQPVTKTPQFGVTLVKKAPPAHANAQAKSNLNSQLTSDLVKRLYAAERKRLAWYERLGIDGDTIGRGQLGQPAYDDVKNPKYFSIALTKCLTHVRLAQLLNHPPASGMHFDMTTYRVKIPASYSQIYRELSLEDFVVAAYLAIRIINATKSGRSSKDTTRFAVALYHGMRTMVVAAQKAVGDEINWAPVETELLKGGHNDEVNYIHEVVK